MSEPASTAVVIKSKTYSFPYNIDTFYFAELVITNNTNAPIFIPTGQPLTYWKQLQTIGQIGIDVEFEGKLFNECCQPMIDGLIEPTVELNLEELLPGATKFVNARFLSDYFARKGNYRVRYTIESPYTKNNFESRFLCFSSDWYDIKIVDR
jgi:hypothetical protein